MPGGTVRAGVVAQVLPRRLDPMPLLFPIIRAAWPVAAWAAVGLASAQPAGQKLPAPGWSIDEPFAAGSYWKTPIPANARYSAPDDPRNRSLQSLPDKLAPNTERFTQWVYAARASDPEVTIEVDARFVAPEESEKNARPGKVTIRLPAAAVPDPGSNSKFVVDGWSCDKDRDGHLTVIDPDGRTAHEFWQACRPRPGVYQATSYARVDLDGDGINISGDYTARTTGQWHNPKVRTHGWGATRAYGGSSLGGLIRAGEVRRGIRHKVMLSLPARVLLHDAKDWPRGYKWPASRPDTAGGTGPNQTIRHGELFAIPRSVDVERMGLKTDAGLALARALQTYGGVVLDQSGVPNINVEGAAAREDGRAFREAGADLALIHRNLVAVDD